MTSPRSWAQTLQYFADGTAKILESPEIRTPTPAEFTAFIDGGLCPHDKRLKAEVRLNRLLATLGKIEMPEWPRGLTGDLDDDEVIEQIRQDEYVFIRRLTKEGLLECYSDALEEVHLNTLDLEETRNNLPPESRPQSFLFPLVEAWINNPGLLPSEPERRHDRILPEPVRHAVPAQTLPAPTGAILPELGQQPARTAYLPGLEPPPGVVVPVLPLQVAKVSTVGAGAPITPRLWFAFQMAMPLEKRTGNEVRLAFTLKDICAWLWPNKWNRARDLPRLREGLRDLYQLGIIWNRSEWLLVRPVKLPTWETRLDDHLLVDVTSLPGSDRGAMINTQVLWELGAKGAVPWRLWIRLAYLWDDAKRRNGGHRIYATRPEVIRGQGGVILDKHGNPVLRNGEKPVLNWSDPRAIRTGRPERNPQSDRVPPLGTLDQALLGFDSATVPPGTLRRRASQTREWLTKLESIGIVALEMVDDGIRVLEPYPTQDRNDASLAPRETG